MKPKLAFLCPDCGAIVHGRAAAALGCPEYFCSNTRMVKVDPENPLYDLVVNKSANTNYDTIVGWRAWNLGILGSKMVRLQSLGLGTSGSRLEIARANVWPGKGRWLEAVCTITHRFPNNHPPEYVEWEAKNKIPQPGVVPVAGCSCGIYVARSLEHLAHLRYNHYGEGGAPTVIGECQVSGKIHVATNGYRAQRARPVKLLVPHTDWKWAQLLRETYQVHVELWNTDDPLRSPV